MVVHKSCFDKGSLTMQKAVIFDMDGTLFQTNKVLEISLEKTFDYLRNTNKWNQDTPIDKYRAIMGVPLSVVWENLLPSHSLKDRGIANNIFHNELFVHIKDGKGALYPHVEEILEYLKQRNYSIYIASNGQVEYLQAIVDYYHLDKWVMETYSIQQIQTEEKADLVSTILKKYTIQEGAVVGDRISDINAAKKNGLTAIGCNFDFAKPTELSQADIVINDLLELKRIFA